MYLCIRSGRPFNSRNTETLNTAISVIRSSTTSTTPDHTRRAWLFAREDKREEHEASLGDFRGKRSILLFLNNLLTTSVRKKVVKEQCWLNEILCAIEWVPEGFTKESSIAQGAETLATEDMLQALLTGTHAPTKIPVEIYLPTSTDTFSATDLSFDVPAASLLHSRQPPKIAMSVPERPPISGFVEIVVSYDHTRPKGVKVAVGAGMGMGVEGSGVDLERLEEVCRRGGVYGLAGRVWKGSEVPSG